MKKKHPTLSRLSEKYMISEDKLLEKLNFLFPEFRPQMKTFHLLDNKILNEYQVKCTGIGNIINEYGSFYQYSFELDDSWKQYSVLICAASFDKYRMPVFTKKDYFLVRFDSHCETQMLFSDMTCDCLGQLNLAMKKIADRGEGAIIHIKTHEGRGKGISSKLDQLSICQALDVDTITASKLRAELIEGINPDDFPADSVIDKRDFVGCVAILKFFNVPVNIKLMLQTNNPNKKRALEENEYNCEYYEIHTTPHERNRLHLNAKKDQLNHLL